MTTAAIDPRVERHIRTLGLPCSLRSHRDYQRDIRQPADFAEALGYPRHGIPPLGLDAAIPVLVASELLGYPTVLVGAGVVGVEIEIATADLVNATRAVVGDITKVR